VVQPGDTIGTIAQRFGMRSADLRSINGLEGDSIRSGQTILVVGAATVPPAAPAAPAPAPAPAPAAQTVQTAPAAPAPAAQPAPAATAAPAEGKSPIPADGLYEVKSGDVLSLIAERHGLRTAQLRELNDLPNDTIKPGQKIRLTSSAVVPAARTSAPRSAPPVGADGLYVVKSGDTVSVIAESFGLKSAELRELNNLSSDTIRPGQKLKVKK
jgi:peptidoglycan endopeptidase LytF/peptidoglycan endopeptidase LytE